MKAFNKWFWGLFFLAAAAMVVASQVNGFTLPGFWGVLATVFLAAVFIQSLVTLHFPIALPVLALLYILYQKPLGLVFIEPWLLVLAAVLGGIGLTLLVRRKPKPVYRQAEGAPAYGGGHPKMVSGGNDDNHPYSEVNFGASSRYLHSTALSSGQFKVSFGALEVFLDEAHLAPGGGELFVDCSFGSLRLYIPKSWQVKEDISAFLGGVSNDTRFAQPQPDGPALLLRGKVQFGGIEIQYV